MGEISLESVFEAYYECRKHKRITSLIFANFYLHEFDIEMQYKFCNYGRYVDDFWVISNNKNNILEARKFAKKYLFDNLLIELSPNKTYVQPYWHGIMFIGTQLKLNRKYVGNRTINQFKQKLNLLLSNDIQHTACTINSYLGFMIHSNSYAIRRNILNLLPKWIWKKCYVEGHIKCLKIKKQYKI